MVSGFGAPLPTCVNPGLASLCDPVVAGFADLSIGAIPPIVADISGGPIPGPFGAGFTAYGPQVDLTLVNTSDCLINLASDIQTPAIFARLPVGAFAQATVLVNFGLGSVPTPIVGPGSFFFSIGFMGQENTGTFVQRHTVGPGAGHQSSLFSVLLPPGTSIFFSLRVAVSVTGIAGGSIVFVGGPEIRLIGLKAGAP